jgi:HEAT repeat protein
VRLRPGWILAAVVGASVVGSLVFWRGVSFGRRLDDAELAEVLGAEASSRKVLHGIVEVTERHREGRPGMDRWHERLVAVSSRPEAHVRRAAAWAMQLGVGDPVVEARLRELLAGDPDATVRRNAACALSLTKDPSAARDVLRSMLEPYVVHAPAAGTVESISSPGRRPHEDELVGRLRGAAAERIEVATTVPGRVVEVRAAVGDTVAAGAPLLVLAPDPTHAFAAAKALAYAGTPEDVPLLRRLMEPGSEMPADVAEQARLAIGAIERRAR